MATLASELKTKWQRAPNTRVRLIARLKDDPTAHLDQVKSKGFTVRHTYSLMAAMALEGKASAALALAKESWVLSIEEDKPVRAM